MQGQVRQVAFRVAGVATPQGSTKSFAFKRHDGSLGTRTTSANPKLSEWRERVANTALYVRRGIFFEKGVAVKVRVLFLLPRPQSLPKRVVEHVTEPDLDKLTRAIGDALTNVLWRDDKQVVEWHTRKRYTKDAACAVISVSEVLSGGRSRA